MNLRIVPALLAGGLSLASCTSTPPLTIQTFTSPPEIVAVNSHLISGATDAILVDAQLFRADADQVVAMVKASGKKLTTIFITHAHPDHYAGLDVIATAYPDAQVVTTQEVLDDFNKVAAGTFAYLQATYKTMIAAKLVTPKAISSLTLEGQTISIVKLTQGEAPASAVLQLPGSGEVLAGDHLYGKSYLYLETCETDAWTANINTLRALPGAKTFYSGHGTSGGAELLDSNIKYLSDVVPILKSGAKVDDVVTQVKAKYPGLVGAGLLTLSTPGYLSACNPRLNLPGDKFYPESLSASADGTVYVSSLPTGQLLKFAPGSTTPTVLIPPGGSGGRPQGATGVLVDEASGSLWRCEIDPTFMAPATNVLRRYQLSDGTFKTAYSFPGANACNDMALDTKGNLYVADSFGKIFRLLKDAAALTLWTTDPLLAPPTPNDFGADGITFDGASNLFVNTFTAGKLIRIPIKADGSADKAVEITVTPALVNPDGMRQLNASTLVVVEGGPAGRLTKVTVTGAAASAVALQTHLDGPTGVAKAGDKYYVSEGQLGHLFGQIPGPPNQPFKVRIFPAQ